MKKGFILAGLLTVLCLTPVYAKAQQLGVYVTPKFIYGATVMDNSKGYTDTDYNGGSERDIAKISSGSDSAFGGSLAIGYNFHKQFNLPIRTEIEYAIFSETENKGSQSTYSEWASGSDRSKVSFEQRFGIQTLFFNAYYDFHTGTAFTPYLGGGLGVAFIDTKAKYKDSYSDPSGVYSYSDNHSTGSKTRSNFAWNIGAGLAYDFTDNIALDLGYRFAGLGSAKTKTCNWNDNGDPVSFHGKTQDIYMHQIALGIRFSF